MKINDIVLFYERLGETIKNYSSEEINYSLNSFIFRTRSLSNTSFSMETKGCDDAESNLNNTNLQNNQVMAQTKTERLQTEEDNYYCTFCQLFVNTKIYLKCHVLWHLYKEYNLGDHDIVQFKFQNDGEVIITCLLCETTMNSDEVLMKHLQNFEHCERFKLVLEGQIPQTSDNLLKQPSTNYVNLKDNAFQVQKHIQCTGPQIDLCDLYQCFVCNTSYNSVSSFLQHFQKEIHLSNITFFYTVKNDSMVNIFNAEGKRTLLCCSCFEPMFSYEDAFNHINGRQNHFMCKQIKDDAIGKDNQQANSSRLPSSSNSLIPDELYRLIDFDYCDEDDCYEEDFTNNYFKDKVNNSKEKKHCKPIEFPNESFLSRHSKKLSTHANDFIRICIEPGRYNIYNMATEQLLFVGGLSPVSEDEYKNIVRIANDKWYFAQKFDCDLCKQQFDLELEFVIHLLSRKHTSNVNRWNILTEFYLCETCLTFGCRQFYAKYDHFTSERHKMFTANNPYMISDMSTMVIKHLNECDKIVETLVIASNEAFLESISTVPRIVNDIVRMVQPVYPLAKAYIFGSRLSQSALCESDVDVFLDCHNRYNLSLFKEDSQFYLESVLSHLKYEDSNTWIIQEVILEARIPLITMKHINSNLQFDICFSNGLSIEKSRLLGVYNTAFSSCRKLILYLNTWLFRCRLSGYNAISKFSISWCIIFYLQVQGILPSVHELIKSKNESKNVGGWECGFVEQFKPVTTELTFKELLKGFFSYYSKFDYRKNVICPLLGQIIRKYDFANPHLLPDTMYIYKQYVNEHREDLFRIDSCMCVQDPIELSQNTAKAISKHKLQIFREYCSKSAAILESQ